MNYLSVESLSKSYGDKILFKDINFGIAQGQKTALVGINGSGKSTLLKIIAGKETPDSGQFSFKNDIKIAYLGQNPDFDEKATVRESVFDKDNPTHQVIKAYEQSIALASEDMDAQNDLTELISKMDELNAWDHESQVQQILGKLGIHDLDAPIVALSGGQRKRVALAGVLISKPDFLILDEPTNHLDLPSIEWLEEYLHTQKLSLLLITHDRYFLDKVTDDIFEIDSGGLFQYKGNYSRFLEQKADRQHNLEQEVDKAKNLLKKEVEWLRRQPKARGTKAKYRVDAVEDIQKTAGQKTTTDKLQLQTHTRRQGNKIAEIDHISKSFDGKQIINDFEYVFQKKQRIGIVGPNGSGKSTFLNILTGKIEPDGGEIITGATTVFGYYQQEEFPFKAGQTLLEVVKDEAEYIKLGNGTEVSASQFLQHFQFPPSQQYKPVDLLSGGEKRRLQLLKVLVKNPNFLILDEPTNDLDLITLNILEDYLLNFQGCLVIVSHDRYFMDKLVEQLFVFEGNGNIITFPGNYSDFRDSDLADLVMKADKPASEKKVEVEKVPEPAAEKSNKQKLSFKEKREYKQLEGKIEQLEAEKAVLISEMNAGDLEHDALMVLAEKIEKAEVELEKMTNRWLALSEHI